MTLSAIASLRPLAHTQCTRQAVTGVLSLHLRSRTGSMHIEAIVRIHPQQARYQSNSVAKPPEKKTHDAPKVTFRQFAGRALGAGLRNMAVALSPSGIKRAYQEAPAVTAMSVIMLLLTLGISVVAVKWYMQAFYNPEFSKFPEPVANTLRRAIYHTNIKPDPELALKYYKKAMQQCAELGLDPFSDEVLGIRIQVSFWLQKIGSHRAAVDVLESILTDCKKWVSIMDLSVKEGKVTADGRYAADEQAKLTKEAAVDPNNKQTAEKSTTATKQDGPEQEPENLWRKRQRLLAKAVGTSVKLGELYSSDHVLEAEKSEPHLVWAVETALSEFKRRKTDGIKPGEQDWLSAEELGGSMESLGRDYERRSQFHLAIPLFFQALRLCKDPCHRVVIMNNLAASFAQYPAGGDSSAARLSESLQHLTDSAMPQTRKDCLEAGENWAKNALAHSKDVKGDERTPECDAGCAVALCNWADVAAMMGKRAVAKTKYLECIEMSSKIGFSQGIEQAREGLARLGEA